jgi:hypothetical protein
VLDQPTHALEFAVLEVRESCIGGSSRAVENLCSVDGGLDVLKQLGFGREGLGAFGARPDFGQGVEADCGD